MRLSYSGNTSAFQADAVSSILSTRSKNKMKKNFFKVEKVRLSEEEKTEKIKEELKVLRTSSRLAGIQTSSFPTNEMMKNRQKTMTLEDELYFRSMWKEKEQCYFMHDKNSNAIKVGRSLNPISRLAAIQTSNPNEIKLLGSIGLKNSKSWINNERIIHDDLKNQGYHIRGEWFRADSLVLNYVGCLLESNLISGNTSSFVFKGIKTYEKAQKEGSRRKVKVMNILEETSKVWH